MKLLATLVLLLLIWQYDVLASDDFFTTTTSPTRADKFSPRLLVTPKDTNKGPIDPARNPVDLARELLKELLLFNLVGKIVQAKHIKDSFGDGLLFELENALQANEVIQAWVDPQGELSKQLQVSQTNRDFFGA